MKTYFRYGYDPWMIGMTVIILIAEALGFFLGGGSDYNPFAHIPFWLLTLYIVSMLAMFLTACFIRNDAFQDEKAFYKSPLTFVAIGILVLAIVAETILGAVYPQATFIPVFFLTISYGITAVLRKNWIALFFTFTFFAIQLCVCFA